MKPMQTPLGQVPENVLVLVLAGTVVTVKSQFFFAESIAPEEVVEVRDDGDGPFRVTNSFIDEVVHR